MNAKPGLVCRMKPYIQPFERKLAIRELRFLAGSEPTPIDNHSSQPISFRVQSSLNQKELAERLAYWETVESVNSSFTRQVLREATVNLSRNGMDLLQVTELLPFGSDIPLPNRRCLRYGPHSIHEYRGKFFPQLVRSLLNVACVKRNSIVLDPMCGSGTTPVEAVLMGCKGIGIDVNPLSLLISKVKCEILYSSPNELKSEYESLRLSLLSSKGKKANGKLVWFDSLPEGDTEYLKRWFAYPVLWDLDLIITHIQTVPEKAIRDLFVLCLSNILRQVSWQKNDDLRVRREIKQNGHIDVIPIFLEEVKKAVQLLLAFLLQDEKFEAGSWAILEGDAREVSSLLNNLRGKVDIVITSPPYATALPYLDTDRLSLSYLRLLPRPTQRLRDKAMIGNREITEKYRRTYWQRYLEEKRKLPEDICEVIDLVDNLNRSTVVGFRRRNLAALLAKYFMDMRKVFQGMLELIRPHHQVFVIIGNNHTIAGGQKVDIRTDTLLGMLGESIGFRLQDAIPMDMLISRDIFKKNAVAAETILCFRRV